MRRALASLLLVLLALPVSAAGPPGADRLAYALEGARVIVSPGKVIDPGVVVVRGGIIEAVGPAGSTQIPADARVIDVKGKVVHAAFIDPHVPTDRLAGKGPKRPKDDDESGGSSSGSAKRAAGPASHPVAAVRAEDRAIDALVVKDDVADTYRRMGFAVVNAAPSAGVLRGSGAVVSLADGPVSGRILGARPRPRTRRARRVRRVPATSPRPRRSFRRRRAGRSSSSRRPTSWRCCARRRSRRR